MSHEQCSYGDLCERLPLQLIECQEKAACHNLVHHTCQSKYEFEHGFEGAMKIRCRECVDSSLEDMNVKSVQEEGESVGNKAQGGGEIPVDECESDDGITLCSSSDIFSETSSCASDSSSCPPKIDEVDFDLSSWKETSQNFNDIAVSFDDAQESFKSSFRKAQLLLQEKVNAQHFANNTFYECDAHGQSLEENLKLFHVLAPNQLWNKILFFLNENLCSNNSSTNNKKRAVNNDSTEAVASTSQSPSIASTVQTSSTTPSPNSNSQCPSPNAISHSPSTDLNSQNTSTTSASTIPSTNLNSPSPSTSRLSHSSDAVDAATSLVSLLNVVSPQEKPSVVNGNSIAKKRKVKSVQPMSMKDLEAFFLITLWSSYHQKSIAHMMKNIEFYPHVKILFERLGREKGFSKIKQSFAVKKTTKAGTWKGHYDENSHAKEIQEMVSRINAEITFPEGLRNTTCDDDKFRNRSKKWEELGHPRKKGLKSYGPVLNVACQCPTGLFVSCGMSTHGENSTQSAQILLQRATGCTNPNMIDMNDAWLNLDRGYNDADFLHYAASVNLNMFFTKKRGSDIPWKFGNVKHKGSEHQKTLPENGCQHVWEATRKFSGNKKLHLIACRNGTGRVTLHVSSSNVHSYSKWTIVPKSLADRRKFLNSSEKESDNIAQWKIKVCKEHQLIELTQHQRTPEWFALRKFLITSTTACHLLRSEKHYDMEEELFLHDDVGIEIVNENQESTNEDINVMQNKSKAELNLLSANELKDVCKKFNKPVSGAKAVLIERILSGPVMNKGNSSRSLLETICMTWFMKPLARNWHLSIGSRNEACVLSALKDINLFDSEVHLERGPVEFGLVQSQQNPWLASSIDGFVVLKVDGENRDVVIEIKTMSAISSKSVSSNKANQSNHFLRCKFGDHNFKQCVKNKSHRVQTLHHALIMNVSTVLFIIADKNKVTQMLLVDVLERQKELCFSIMCHFKDNLKFVHENNVPFPTDVTDDGLKQKGYHVDVAAVKLHLGIWKGLRLLVEKYQKPLPAAKMIVPTGIAYWNLAKVHVDVMSRLLKHVIIREKQAHPAQLLIIRLLLMCVANAFIATKILNISDDDFANDSITHKDMKKKMCKTVGSFDEYVKELAKNWHVPGYSHILQRAEVMEAIGNDSYGKLPKDRRLTASELSYFHDCALGKNGSRKNKHRIFNSGYPKIIRLSNEHHMHICKPIIDPKSKKTIQRNCAACLVARKKANNKKTTLMCNICGVPLCITRKGRSYKTCFEKWHETVDLEKLRSMTS